MSHNVAAGYVKEQGGGSKKLKGHVAVQVLDNTQNGHLAQTDRVLHFDNQLCTDIKVNCRRRKQCIVKMIGHTALFMFMFTCSCTKCLYFTAGCVNRAYFSVMVLSCNGNFLKTFVFTDTNKTPPAKPICIVVPSPHTIAKQNRNQ